MWLVCWHNSFINHTEEFIYIPHSWEKALRWLIEDIENYHPCFMSYYLVEINEMEHHELFTQNPNQIYRPYI